LSTPEVTDELSRLATDAVAALKSRGLTVATAEATTGRLIGHLLVSVPGSSAVFKGGVAPYSNSMKRAIGVPAEVLEQRGAVSPEAAEALSVAVREWAGAAIGLAETGIAGPTGGTAERPVGRFWLAVATSGGVAVERHQYNGDRTSKMRSVARKGLELLLNHYPKLT